jgi:glycosyltransferase involved in cell wall biosynthesis
MGRQPALSIGVPVYNGERYLRQTLEALLAQTFTDFELIISDNASTDGTEAICREFAARDPRVRYHRADVNIGAARNYRRVFELSAAEYFKWHASDDLVEPTFVERCMEALRRDPAVVLAYTETQLIDADGRRLAAVPQDVALRSPSASARFRRVLDRLGYCNVIYGVLRRDVLARTGLMGTFMHSDAVLIAEVSLHGQFYEVQEVLFSRRIHPAAYSSQGIDEKLRFYTPGQKRRLSFERWRMMRGYAQAIARSGVALAEQRVLWLTLLRLTSWQRGPLAREAWQPVAGLMAGILRHE